MIVMIGQCTLFVLALQSICCIITSGSAQLVLNIGLLRGVTSHIVIDGVGYTCIRETFSRIFEVVSRSFNAY